MVTPSTNRGRDVGRAGKGPTHAANTMNGKVRVSDAQPQVKLVSMPYSFSQQMPSLHQTKAPTPDSLSQTTKGTWSTKPSISRATSSSPNGIGAWGSKSKSAEAKKPSTAAEIVASKPQQKSINPSRQNSSGAQHEFELYSKLVPKTSVVPKIPGRIIKSSNVLRGPGRNASTRTPVPPHIPSAPVKSVSKPPPNTKLQSLSSSSASVERKRKALGAAAAAANGGVVYDKMRIPAEANPSAQNNKVKSKGSDITIAELEAAIADRGRRVPVDKTQKISLSSQPLGKETRPSSDSMPKKTFSQFSMPGSEERKNVLPRSASLSSASFRNGTSRSLNAKKEQPRVNSNTASRLSKIIELRKGGRPSNHNITPKANENVNETGRASAPPGFGRAPAAAFFTGSDGRKPPHVGVGPNEAGATNKPRERLNLPPPIPKNNRADALKKAFMIESKASTQNEGGRRNSRTLNVSRDPQYQRGNRDAVGKGGRVEEKTKKTSFYRTSSQRTVEQLRRKQISHEKDEVPRKQATNDEFLVPLGNNYQQTEEFQRENWKRTPGVIGKPPSPFPEKINGFEGFANSGNAGTPHGFHSLWSEPNLHSGVLGGTSGMMSSPVLGYVEANGNSSAVDEGDELPPLPTSNEPAFDAVLHQLGIRPQMEEAPNDANRQHIPHQRYYSHF
eukprot:Plantae.Rhodophyta-Hildenbrandia_rubra.ctg304.p1 GENE.Plantae.Rhodophyta-Hildenbrandia_rubra.ctg304~~Plantae.Rhodophyta-Hildenbrandia_rubra.ctg304.p1  ORF type:complete len:673 (-),score=111.36 Plantae.Rhodophyta-Hildenbrandia_rubra.ctg304:2421-4439(-)